MHTIILVVCKREALLSGQVPRRGPAIMHSVLHCSTQNLLWGFKPLSRCSPRHLTTGVKRYNEQDVEKAILEPTTLHRWWFIHFKTENSSSVVWHTSQQGLCSSMWRLQQVSVAGYLFFCILLCSRAWTIANKSYPVTPKHQAPLSLPKPKEKTIAKEINNPKSIEGNEDQSLVVTCLNLSLHTLSGTSNSFSLSCHYKLSMKVWAYTIESLASLLFPLLVHLHFLALFTSPIICNSHPFTKLLFLLHHGRLTNTYKDMVIVFLGTKRFNASGGSVFRHGIWNQLVCYIHLFLLPIALDILIIGTFIGLLACMISVPENRRVTWDTR